MIQTVIFKRRLVVKWQPFSKLFHIVFDNVKILQAKCFIDQLFYFLNSRRKKMLF